FGAGPEFEQDLSACRFLRIEARSFLLGATRLWVAESVAEVGQKPTARPETVRGAIRASGESTQADAGADTEHAERETWRLVQAVTSATLTAALAWALVVWINVHADLPLTPPQ